MTNCQKCKSDAVRTTVNRVAGQFGEGKVPPDICKKCAILLRILLTTRTGMLKDPVKVFVLEEVDGTKKGKQKNGTLSQEEADKEAVNQTQWWLQLYGMRYAYYTQED